MVTNLLGKYRTPKNSNNYSNGNRRGMSSSFVPLARASTVRFDKPSVNQANTITVHRREMVGTVSNGASTGFVVTDLSNSVPGYDLSASSPILFPWLSRLASAYEKFQFRNLSFELVTGQAASTGGRVYLACDPDWDDDVPSTKEQMMGLACSINGPVWSNVRLSVPTSDFAAGLPWRFCSSQSRYSGSEPRTAFYGFLCVATDTSTANLSWDLYVEYTVDLMTPTAESIVATDSTAVFTGQVPQINTAGTRYLISPQASTFTNDVAKLVTTPGAIGSPFPTTYDGVPINSVIKIPKQTNGMFGIALEHAIAGVSPADDINLNGRDLLCRVYNAAGTYLGALASIANWSHSIGAHEASTINTAGSQTQGSQVGRIADLLTTYPTATYIVPYVTSAIAGLSTYGRFSLFNKY